MLKIFLSSHGHFASGIKSSLDILCGATDNITVFDAYVDEQNIKDCLDEFYENVSDDDQVLLLSDLYGGSVNQQMALYLDRSNTFLVAGVNLACVLELSLKETITNDELLATVKQSQEMLRVVDLQSEELTEDEFF